MDSEEDMDICLFHDHLRVVPYPLLFRKALKEALEFVILQESRNL